jgi:hypothetical protein
MNSQGINQPANLAEEPSDAEAEAMCDEHLDSVERVYATQQVTMSSKLQEH